MRPPLFTAPNFPVTLTISFRMTHDYKCQCRHLRFRFTAARQSDTPSSFLRSGTGRGGGAAERTNGLPADEPARPLAALPSRHRAPPYHSLPAPSDPCKTCGKRRQSGPGPVCLGRVQPDSRSRILRASFPCPRSKSLISGAPLFLTAGTLTARVDQALGALIIC